MSGLIANFKFIATTDLIANFADFEYYNAHEKGWSFEWERWARLLRRIKPGAIDDPEDYRLEVDYRDLLIVKELQKNGRKTFAELAPILGISLQAVKYRYDRLVRIGAIKHFAFDVWRFPVEISAYHEVMLQFTSDRAMKAFFALMPKLIFVYSVAKVIGENSLMVRTYLPESQVTNMFGFFSELAKTGFIASYSSVRLNFAGRQTQTISYELFQDGKGWSFNLDESLSELSRLTPRRIPAELLERINQSPDQRTFESALR
jgi:DNA-binding Lrp family transcriptional regulator